MAPAKPSLRLSTDRPTGCALLRVGAVVVVVEGSPAVLRTRSLARSLARLAKLLLLGHVCYDLLFFLLPASFIFFLFYIPHPPPFPPRLLFLLSACRFVFCSTTRRVPSSRGGNPTSPPPTPARVTHCSTSTHTYLTGSIDPVLSVTYLSWRARKGGWGEGGCYVLRTRRGGRGQHIERKRGWVDRIKSVRIRLPPPSLCRDTQG